MSQRDKILIYRGVGNSSKVLVRGHYFKKYPVRKLIEGHGQIQNLKQAYRRFRLKPHKDRKLIITLGNENKHIQTGSDGYFEALLDHKNKVSGWYEMKVKDAATQKEEAGSYFVPDETSSSVISDIDDTVLISHSTRFLRKMRLILFRNAHSRRSTKSVQSEDWMSNFVPDDEVDSYFYVSSSEWNLYDFLADFFELKGLPRGLFFLKRLKTSPLKLIRSGGGHHDHKLESINFLFDFYPKKSFYLIGDSGQKDIHIYMEATRKDPSRVKGVLIRKIRKNSRKKVIEEADLFYRELNIPFHAFSDKEIAKINIDS